MNAGLRLLAIATLSFGLPFAAGAQSLSKSVEQGWNSVIKDAKKAAKQVSKAANDAMSSKPQRKRTSKRKTDADKSQAKASDDPTDNNLPDDKTEAAAAKSEKKAAAKPTTRDDAAEAEIWATEPDHSRAAKRSRERPDRGQPDQSAIAKSQASPAPTTQPLPKADTTWTAEKSLDDRAANKANEHDAIPSVDVVPIKPTQDGRPGSSQQKLPITMIPPKPEGSVTPSATWSKEEIEAAKANCTAVLRGLDAVTIAEAPVREGHCGTPAPVRLVSLGKDPQVALVPAPLVTCDLVAGLHGWMRNEIQPLARKELGGPVTKIETMSDYSCRMAYGRKGNKLSEHGRANALDIRAFVTAKGEAANLLQDWGKTVRDLAAEAAAKAAAEAAANEAANAAAAAGAKSATVQDTTKITVALPAGAAGATAQTKLGAAWLGPRDKREAERAKAALLLTPPEPQSKKAKFLHEAHKSACRVFGTTLGPESNEAHRNHFHVDMAERKRTKICE